MKPQVSIVICAKNEEKNLPWVLKGIIRTMRKIPHEIIVVDGHSTDGTTKIAKKNKCRVVFDNNRGKGDAIRVGGDTARSEIILFIDADGSHSPKDIPKLLAPIIKNKFDHVSGSRMLGGSDELHKNFGQFIRLIGSAIITLTINYKLNVKLTDCQNGFRAIKKSVFEKLDLTENITTIEQEMIIKTLKRGYSLTEVPTHEYERRSGNSHIVIWKYSYRYVYSCLKHLLF